MGRPDGPDGSVGRSRLRGRSKPLRNGARASVLAGQRPAGHRERRGVVAPGFLELLAQALDLVAVPAAGLLESGELGSELFDLLSRSVAGVPDRLELGAETFGLGFGRLELSGQLAGLVFELANPGVAFGYLLDEDTDIRGVMIVSRVTALRRRGVITDRVGVSAPRFVRLWGQPIPRTVLGLALLDVASIEPPIDGARRDVLAFGQGVGGTCKVDGCGGVAQKERSFAVCNGSSPRCPDNEKWRVVDTEKCGPREFCRGSTCELEPRICGG